MAGRGPSGRRPLFALVGVLLPLWAAGCGGSGSSAAGDAGGTGGVQGSGGAASGGTTGSGGRAETGGTVGSGGHVGSGGTVAGSGGTSGSGGASASGGSPGRASGGPMGSGGVSASGGTVGTIGTAGTAGPGSGGGGRLGSGGSAIGGAMGTGGAAGGAPGKLTPQDAARLMSPGWNLGNSFDATPQETSWGNPTPTQAFINAVHTAGFKTLRLAVTWSDHVGGAPGYTVDAAWMDKVKQTAQWAVDAGMYVFVNTHHEADGGGTGWVTFPATSDAAAVASEVTAVWTQIATAFASFDSHLMLECFNEPNEGGGGGTAQAQTDLNMYLEACVKAIRGTGGSNATRIVMIQPVGASPIQAGIQSIQKTSIINDPNLVISLHTYYPTNFGLSQTPYAWGSAADYTSMQSSIMQQIRVWLPTQVVFIGEWGSMGAQTTANRAAHAQAYAQDTTTAGLVPIWWDNGGSGSGSFALFDRTTGAVTQPSVVAGIMTGVKNALVAPNTWATHP